MAGRTIVVDGETWEVAPAGRATVYDRDQFAGVLEQGTGPEPRRRSTRCAPVGSRSPYAALPELSETRLVDAFPAGPRAGRQRRAEQIVEHLHRLGVAIELRDVVEAADGGALGRPHVARVLVQRGVCVDMNDAFGRYLGRGRPAYVEKPLPTLPQVAELVHTVGGIVVAAHVGAHGTEGQIRQFQEQGPDGLEVRPPSHSPGAERRLTGIAQRLGLAISGGSDWHGDMELGDSHAPLGGLDIPLEWLEHLEERRATTSSETVPQNRKAIT